MMAKRSKSTPGTPRRFVLAGLMALLAGCTVEPLYQSSIDGAVPAAQAPLLAQVTVAEAPDRVTQQVRNRLLFLLHRGGAADPQPRYNAELTVASATQGIFRVETPDGSANVTSRRVTLTGTLTLTTIGDGTVLARETRSANASFENTAQEFANLRAQRDAENRAAAELAEQFRIAIATRLSES